MLNLTAFNLRALGDTLTIITLAKRSGVTDIVALETMVTNAMTINKPRDRRSKAIIREEQMRMQQDRIPKIRCSVCKQIVRLLRVNDKPNTQVGGTAKSCGLCMNPECMNTDYYDETLQEKREEGLLNGST